MLLNYFGENFDEKDCLGSCDNCKKDKSFVIDQDLTNLVLLLP